MFLEHVVKLDPNFIPALLELGKIRVNRKENRQALQLFKRVLEIDNE